MSDIHFPSFFFFFILNLGKEVILWFNLDFLPLCLMIFNHLQISNVFRILGIQLYETNAALSEY